MTLSFSRPRSGSRGVLGFTLFEVSISLLILTAVVTIIFLLISSGLKAQQRNRLQMLASVKMMELSEAWANPPLLNVDVSMESAEMAESGTKIEHDLESRLFHKWKNLDGYGMRQILGWNGVSVVPPEIAARLESDNNEIAEILAGGGQLYFFKPNSGLEEEGQNGLNAIVAGEDKSVSNEERQLVFAVRGPQQQNSLPGHPILGWPYYEHYPFPLQPWHMRVWHWNLERTSPVKADPASGLQSVAAINILEAGSGYSEPPQIDVAPAPPGGRTAKARAIVNRGVLCGVHILDPGYGYASAPAITVTRRNGNGLDIVPKPAVLTSRLGPTSTVMVDYAPDLATGGVQRIQVTCPGRGYTSDPTITFVGACSSTPTVTIERVSGGIGSITIVSPGSGYTVPPIIQIVGGGGSGAAASAVLRGPWQDRHAAAVAVAPSASSFIPDWTAADDAFRQIYEYQYHFTRARSGVVRIVVTNGGAGYLPPPYPPTIPPVTVTVQGGNGSGCVAVPTVTAGAITAIAVTAPGSNYTVAPKVRISGGGGSGATAIAEIEGQYTYLPQLGRIQNPIAGPSGWPKAQDAQRDPVNRLTASRRWDNITSNPPTSLSMISTNYDRGDLLLDMPDLSEIADGEDVLFGDRVRLREYLVRCQRLVRTLLVPDGGSPSLMGYVEWPVLNGSDESWPMPVAPAAFPALPLHSLPGPGWPAANEHVQPPPYKVLALSYLLYASHLATTRLGTVPASREGTILSITVEDGGLYTAALPVPTVTVSGGGGLGCTGTAVMSENLPSTVPPTYRVSSISLTSSGTGYTARPAVTLSGGAVTTNARASAEISPIPWADRIGWIKRIPAFGSGFTQQPLVRISGGTGQGCRAQAILDQNGTVSRIVVLDPGSGYSSASPPTIELLIGGAVQASAALPATDIDDGPRWGAPGDATYRQHELNQLRTYYQQLQPVCEAWFIRYASADPYNLGAPRPANRALAWDHPLLEHDLFPSGDMRPSAAMVAALPNSVRDFAQTLPAASPFRWHHGDADLLSAALGGSYSLFSRNTAPGGTAATLQERLAIERERPAWRSGQHNAKAPSVWGGTDGTPNAANVDRAWKVIAERQPSDWGPANGMRFWDGGGRMYKHPLPPGSPGDYDNASHLLYSWGNNARFNLTDAFHGAERCREVVFWAVDWMDYEDFETAADPPIDSRSIANTSAGYGANSNRGGEASDNAGTVFDSGGLRPFTVFAVQHPVDRNGNGRPAGVSDRSYDTGNVKPTVRMRASSIARFVYYDGRLIGGLRQ